MSAGRPRTVRIAGLYALTPDTGDTARLVAAVAAAMRGGASLIQYRNKSASPALKLEQAAALAELCNAHSVPLIVNDDPGLAAAVGAAGVHVGGDDAPVVRARAALGPDRVVGASCYGDYERARRAVADGADYVAFGSFFSSPTKPAAVRAGIDLVQRAQSSLGVPVVAIGGIDAVNVSSLIDAGVDAVAVITAVFGAADVESAAQRIARCFGQRGGSLA